MHLRVRPMEPSDVSRCAKLLASHHEECRGYGPLLEQLPAVWLKLLRTGSTISSVVEDTEARVPQMVAWGASVFVTDALARRLKTTPLAWIGPELARRLLAGEASILSPKAIQEANSNDGLNLAVCVGVARAPSLEDQSAVDIEVHRAFFRDHVGYRLKELMCQPLELRQSRMAFQAGLYWLGPEGHYVDGRSLAIDKLIEDPFIIGTNRELALRDLGNWASSLFLHTPPRIYFRPAEQRLLLAALRGLADEELADELTISLSAVKKKWRTIYDRAAKILPRYSPDDAAEDPERKRGKERKKYLLAYLSEHMEELRPVLPPSGHSGRTEASGRKREPDVRETA